MARGYDSEQLLILHQRLVEGDRTASEEICNLLLMSLIKEVKKKYPRTDEHIISDGSVDAILEYCEKPQTFDATLGIPLERFLKLAATRNVQNFIRGEERRKAREEKYGKRTLETSVELDVAAGNIITEEILARMQEMKAILNILDDPLDKKIKELSLQGERRTEVFAEILGITHLSKEQQKREVKRAKDRIDKKIRRYKDKEVTS